jgi:catechol 2,3-dioxygenase-like lactoylglutathione lyase family enzyme
VTNGRVTGFDHVALPMRDAAGTAAFYRSLGLEVVETAYLVRVYFGPNMINFHRPEVWQQPAFALRAPAATPPCGDLCFVWEGPPAELATLLQRIGADVVEGPVQRHGGRRSAGVSTYIRDPDGNLLEFLIYGPGEQPAAR